MKKILKEYLTFSKQDRNAILFLAILIGIVIGVKIFIVPLFNHSPSKAELAKQDSLAAKLSAEINEQKQNNYYSKSEQNEASSADVFIPKSNEINIQIHQPFNPNEYGFEDWKNAGFPEKFAKTIANYLAKGGKIRKPEDLKKVYGMKDDWYQKIEPFVSIPELKKENNYTVSTSFSKPKLSVVELNTADSAALEALPLIGGKTAMRIIKYRTLIGGFVSLNQLKEVWGFKDSILMVNEKRIAIDVAKISKININTAGLEQLKKHPYIKFNKAKLLIAFREQHGKYHTADELKNSKAFTDEDVKKIAPYLIFE
ncbi:MAG: hypothetical protein RI955_1847 [Bacteroidota bacterium]